MKNFTLRRIYAVLLASVLTLSLMGCHVGGSASSSADNSAAESTTITLQDQAGREVTLEGPAQSIVSCYYITTYATMALGVSDRVIGLEKKADSRPIYHLSSPALLELPDVGSLKEFNVEADSIRDVRSFLLKASMHYKNHLLS